jgi:hypothetical protein
LSSPPNEVVDVWGLDVRPGRHRRPEIATVHLVFADHSEHVLAADGALARSMSQVVAEVLAPSGVARSTRW